MSQTIAYFSFFYKKKNKGYVRLYTDGGKYYVEYYVNGVEEEDFEIFSYTLSDAWLKFKDFVKTEKYPFDMTFYWECGSVEIFEDENEEFYIRKKNKIHCCSEYYPKDDGRYPNFNDAFEKFSDLFLTLLG